MDKLKGKWTEQTISLNMPFTPLDIIRPLHVSTNLISKTIKLALMCVSQWDETMSKYILAVHGTDMQGRSKY